MFRAFFIALLFVMALPAHADAITLRDLAKDSRGKVLFIRHALAPGTGDPSNFTLGDCSTQRNLNDEGRQQARRIGENIRKAGLKIGKVYSSQWCRCIDTVKLMDVGPVQPFEGLNSFYEQTEKEEAFIAKLKKLLATFDRNGDLVIMVTHFVTIAAVTDEGADSGGGVVMSLKDRSVKELSDLN